MYLKIEVIFNDISYIIDEILIIINNNLCKRECGFSKSICLKCLVALIMSF